MAGLRKKWYRGPHALSVGIGNRGQNVVRLGKNGGPVIKQVVELHLVPKERRASALADVVLGASATQEAP